MRYRIRQATSADLARIAGLMGDTGEAWDQAASMEEAVDRLTRVWRLSRLVWIATDRQGVPGAVFGVAPVADEPAIGQFWMLFLASFDDGEEDSRAVTRLVVDEMLGHFPELENFIDARRTWALDLLRTVGFTVEPAGVRPSGTFCHRVWLAAKPTRMARAN
jgi:hypothetical protein